MLCVCVSIVVRLFVGVRSLYCTYLSRSPVIATLSAALRNDRVGRQLTVRVLSPARSFAVLCVVRRSPIRSLSHRFGRWPASSSASLSGFMSAHPQRLLLRPQTALHPPFNRSHRLRQRQCQSANPLPDPNVSGAIA